MENLLTQLGASIEAFFQNIIDTIMLEVTTFTSGIEQSLINLVTF